jgi:16S rRNA processing protein RimM
MAKAPDTNDRVCVGAIAGSFGVRGEVRIKSFCATPEDVGTYGALTSEDGAHSYDIRLTRPVKAGFAARLSGVTTKEEADALRGARLFAPRSALPSLPDDEFYHADLIGLDVQDTGGAPRGRVTAVLNHGAGDLLELRVPGHKGTVLVPFTQEIVPTVDLAQARIVIDPPEGLFDD